ncbi:hypothetical protein KC872_03775, partial [Candidatus Kaiserbacteria bacterium]|nr:hypothetical protein [Candidatus Kaiserbacteria bacterium]
MTQVTKTAAQTAKKAANVQVDCFTIGDDGVLTNGINLVGNRLTFGTRSISIDKHHPCHTMGGYMLSTAMFTVTPRFDSKPFLTFVAPSDTNPSALMVMIDLSKSNKPWEEKFTVGAYGTAESIMQSNPMRGL